MRPTAVLAPYLNDYFAVEAWRPAADLLGNITLSEADEFVRSLPLCNGLINSQFDFSRPPGAVAGASDTVTIRIPGATAIHHLETEVAVSDPLPNINLGVDFQLDLVANAAAAVPNINVGVQFSWGSTISNIALALLDPPAAVAKAVIEDAIEHVLSGVLAARLREQISAIGSYRFDRTRDLQFAAPGAQPITGVFGSAYQGGIGPQQRGYCDVLVVADGFSAANIASFDALATAIASYFSGTSSTPLEKPFLHLASGIRIWKMSLVAANSADIAERVVVPVQTADRITMNFANLARIAEIGLTARGFFGRDPIVVFASMITALDRQNAGITSSDNLRENSQGPYVLLDASKSAADLVPTLVHELGHTPLGRYLADEYGHDSGRVYRGLEPQARNVSTNPLLGLAKWQPWSGNPLNPANVVRFVAADLRREGAYDFDRQIFRYADTCRMRTSSSGAFCDVCAEELTLGIVEHGHQVAGLNNADGMADILVEYLSPWTEAQPRRVHLEGGGSSSLLAFVGGRNDHTTTRVRLTLVGSSVPQHWSVQWSIAGVGGYGTSAQLTGTTIQAAVVLGSTVQVTVTHELSTGLIASTRPAPTTSGQLVFNVPRTIAAADLRPPTSLRQSVALGAVLQLAIDPANGRVSLPQSLSISADIGGVQNFDVLTQTEFRLTGQSGRQQTHRSGHGRRGENRQWSPPHIPAPDQYTWSASTVWDVLTGNPVQAPRGPNGLCFTISALPFATDPSPPADPFDVILLETATFPSLPSGLRASSWSPNDRAVKFQFEVKHVNTAFDGSGLQETLLLSRDRGNVDSVAVTGTVALNVFPGASGVDFYHWRVRAVDDRGLASNWVEGRQFAFCLVAQRPTTLAHLTDVLDRINPAMLERLPRTGPIDDLPRIDEVPRVYVIAQWQMPERDTDFSTLEKFARRPTRLIEPV